MYKIGDWIIYGSTGVCKVENIITAGDGNGLDYLIQGKQYYCLESLYQKEMIYTPVENPKVFMRPIITAEDAEKLIMQIPTIRVQAFHSSNMQELRNHYQALTNTFNCLELIKLAMSIYAKKQELLQRKRKMGQIDERFMKQAEEMLYGEFAVALNIKREEVAQYIKRRIEEAQV